MNARAEGPDRPHLGHFIAFGVTLARSLSETGIRHRALTREHVLWSPRHGVIQIMSAGATEQMSWPRDARFHTKDMEVFAEEFGSAHAAGVRLGYVYGLGPIAEWIFYRASDDGELAAVVAPPAIVSEHWLPLSSDMMLGRDATLSRQGVADWMARGIRSRGQGHLAASKRTFLRCLIAGAAADDQGLECAALANLASVFMDEERHLRAYVLSLLAGRLAEEDDMGMEYLLALKKQVDPFVSDHAKEALLAEARSWSGIGLAEAMWRFDDLEIRKALAGSSPS